MRNGAAPRVLILDENRVGREGIAALLAEKTRIVVVGTTASRQLALKMSEDGQVDVVLAGASVIAKHGTELATEIVRKGGAGAVKVVVIGLSERSLEISEVVEAGVHGYLTKSASLVDLEDMVRAVVQSKGAWTAQSRPNPLGRDGHG